MRPRLTQAQRREMVSWLAHPPRQLGVAADRWTGRELAALVERRFGVKHSPAYCLRLCNAMGASMKAAYKLPLVEKQRGIAGRPPKVRGEMLPRLKRALVEASRHRQRRGWTRRELAAFIREQCGIICTPVSVEATLARMQLSLLIIPEWQRRVEERDRRPSRRQRARRLTIEQLAELSAALQAKPEVARSPEMTRSLIRQRFGVTYATSYIPNLLRELAIRRRGTP
jgi:transposase